MVSASSSSISTAASSSAAVTEASCRTSWLHSALQVKQATLQHFHMVASHWSVQQVHGQAQRPLHGAYCTGAGRVQAVCIISW